MLLKYKTPHMRPSDTEKMGIFMLVNYHKMMLDAFIKCCCKEKPISLQPVGRFGPNFYSPLIQVYGVPITNFSPIGQSGREIRPKNWPPADPKGVEISLAAITQ